MTPIMLKYAIITSLVALILHFASKRSHAESYDSRDPRNRYSSLKPSNYKLPPELDVDKLVKELTVGEKGYVLISGLFTKEEIDLARETSLHLIETEGQYTIENWITHPGRQWHWDLFNKAEIYARIASHPIFPTIIGEILGRNFQLGSFAVNTVFPGGTAMKPHVDYPYWDIAMQPENWPGILKSVPNSGFPLFLNMQAIVMLDPFTAENGATAVRPGSHLSPGPFNATEFFEDYVQVEGKPGDVFFYPGLIQHCSMPNKQREGSRTGILMQFLPKWVIPMEDFRGMIEADKIAAFPKVLRDMLPDHQFPGKSDGAGRNNVWRVIKNFVKEGFAYVF